jgi:hypothetical protein
MNFKEMILSTIKGEPTNTLPFIPRLDIWYKANKLNGTLPNEYKNASLRDITDDLIVGYHAVMPDFRDYRDENDDMDVGLGIYRFKTIPYTVEFHNIKRNVTHEKYLTSVEYITPYGNITTKVLYNEFMKKSGSTLAHVMEYAIKGIKDYKPLAYIFDNAEIRPKYDGYQEFKEYIGHRGILAAFNSLGVSPMHFIMKELMSTETFFYESFDHPEELDSLAEIISKFYYKVFDTVVKSPSEIILSGANYDSAITTPPFFEKYIVPSLNKQAKILHENDKFLLTHTDGENKGLIEHYLKSGFDIADSICPAPMTGLTLKEIKEDFDGKITIWGGIPSISVLENSMNDYEFDKFIDMTIESIGRGDHMIFSIADTTPPDAKFERIKSIIKKTREFGSVN